MTDALPKPVRKQIESANRAYNSVYGNPEAKETAAAAETPDTEQQPAAEQQPPAAEQQPAAPHDAPENPQQEPKPSAYERLERQNDARRDDPKYWADRYAVLEGKYNREVKEAMPKLRAEIDALRSELADAKAGGNAQPTDASGQSTEAALSELRSSLESEFGPDVAAQLQRYVQMQIEPLQRQAKAAEVSQVKDRTHAFWRELYEAVPDWEKTDAREDWHEWLGERDPISGEVRDVLLNRAYEARNAPRVIAMFRAFDSEIGNKADAQAEKVADPPPSPQRKVMPASRPATSGQAPGAPARSWSRSQIKRFYADKQNGEYSPEQAHALETDMYAAITEGRITND